MSKSKFSFLSEEFPILANLGSQAEQYIHSDPENMTFNTAEYKYNLDVLYTPETSLSKEKTEYTLLEIEECTEDSNAGDSLGI